MPNRMLRDWTLSDKVNIISVYGERFFTRLIMKADDHGCFHADSRVLKANLFPLLLDSVREADLLRWMAECQKAGLIVLYESEKKKYLQIVDFRQRLDKARSKFPLPKSTDFPEVVNEFLPELEPEEELRKRKNTGAPPAPPARERKLRKDFIPPSVAELKQYFILKIGDTTKPGHWPEDKCSNQADLMHDHYKTNGWVQAKGKPVVDWQAACRNWIRRALSGEFDNRPAAAKDRPAATRAPRREEEPALNKIQEELNSMYELWNNNPDHCTVISVTAEHYNFLKSHHMIAFSEQEAAGIRVHATTYMKEKSLEGDQALTRLMKAFGVLEFFNQLKTQGKEAVFYAVA